MALNCDLKSGAGSPPVFPYVTNRLGAAYLMVRYTERLHGIMEDAMRLQLRCHGDIDLSQPGMQVEIRSHIARCLRDYPNGGEGVITWFISTIGRANCRENSP